MFEDNEISGKNAMKRKIKQKLIIFLCNRIMYNSKIYAPKLFQY